MQVFRSSMAYQNCNVAFMSMEVLSQKDEEYFRFSYLNCEDEKIYLLQMQTFNLSRSAVSRRTRSHEENVVDIEEQLFLKLNRSSVPGISNIPFSRECPLDKSHFLDMFSGAVQKIKTSDSYTRMQQNGYVEILFCRCAVILRPSLSNSGPPLIVATLCLNICRKMNEAIKVVILLFNGRLFFGGDVYTNIYRLYCRDITCVRLGGTAHGSALSRVRSTST